MNDIKIGKIFLGRYKIISEIGRGGMDSAIYLAENINFNKENNHYSEKYHYAAIKFITKAADTSEEQWNKILDESVTNARLTQSNNIVQLYEMHPLSKDSIALVMEYINGCNLKEFIRDRVCLPVLESIWIFKKIVQGVIEMHNKDRVIIHRDLKPENIMLSKDLLDVKIADFGISSVLIEDNTSNDYVLTDEKSFFGTVAYVTPDALPINDNSVVGNKKTSRITKQYDFHSLGIIFYEMLVGEKPFNYDDENDVGIINYWKKMEIVPMKYFNKNIRNEIENIIIRLTASNEKTIKYRYIDALEILNDLSSLEEKIKNDLPEDPPLLPYNERKYQNDKLLPNLSKRNITFKYVFKTHSWLIFGSIIFIIFIILIIVFISYKTI